MRNAVRRFSICSWAALYRSSGGRNRCHTFAHAMHSQYSTPSYTPRTTTPAMSSLLRQLGHFTLVIAKPLLGKKEAPPGMSKGDCVARWGHLGGADAGRTGGNV